MASLITKLRSNAKIAKIGEWYTAQSGYRSRGLFADDLLITETDRIQEALRRLPRRDFYDRIFRLRRAVSLSTNQETLPQAEWTTAAQDKPYLTDIAAGVDAEVNDKQFFDQMLGVPKELASRNKY